MEDLRGRGGLGGGLPLVPRFRDGDDAVRYVSSARDVEAVLEDVGRRSLLRLPWRSDVYLGY